MYSYIYVCIYIYMYYVRADSKNIFVCIGLKYTCTHLFISRMGHLKGFRSECGLVGGRVAGIFLVSASSELVPTGEEHGHDCLASRQADPDFQKRALAFSL